MEKMDAQSVPETLNQEIHKKAEQQIDPSQSSLNSKQDQQSPEQANQNIVSQQPIQNPPEKSPEIGEPVLSVVESGGAPLGEGQIQVQHQQNAYYLQNVLNGLGGDQRSFGLQGGDQQNVGFPGLNPAAAAAVAALSQLTQFAGSMVDVERAMVELQGFIAAGGLAAMGVGGVADQFFGQGPMNYGNFQIGRPPYWGGGRRGGDRYRRGGRGNFRNRGRGRWTPGRVSEQVASYAHPGNSASEVEKSVEEVAGPEAVNVDKTVQAGMSHQQSVPVTITSAPEHYMRVVRCELCKITCNTMEVLEQHRNGKKHKKNLEKFGVQESCQPVATIQSNGEDVTASNPDGKSQVVYMHNGEENKLPVPGRTPVEALTDNTENENKQIQLNQPQNPGAEQSYMQSQPGIHPFENQRVGMKRKMRGGRGGKRMNTFDAPRRPRDPNKPKVATPLICDLCNVKCDTQEVFDRHLSGKKHISKYKRFQSHQAMYGPVGLQVLYPPNPTQTSNQPQGYQQTVSAPHSSVLPPGAHSAAQVYPAVPPNQVSGGN